MLEILKTINLAVRFPLGLRVLVICANHGDAAGMRAKCETPAWYREQAKKHQRGISSEFVKHSRLTGDPSLSALLR